MKNINKNSYLNSKFNGFLILYFGFCFLMTVNFFLTENPFAARHSGGTARWLEAYSETWTLHVGVLLMVALVVATLATVRRFLYKPILQVFAVALWLIVSGFYTGALRIHPSSYLYIGLTYCFVSILAINDNRKMKMFDEKFFFTFIITTYFLGIFLSFYKPEVWGWIPFGFSRLTRGEVTLSEIFGLPLVLTTSFIAFKNTKKFYLIIALMCLSIVEVSFYTRQTIWMLFFPFILYGLVCLFENILKNKIQFKILVWMIMFGYLFSFFSAIYFYIYYFDLYELEKFLNGRMPLWQWHFELFIDSPMFGSGIFPEQPYYYTGSADSEVGLLAAFSQFGLPFGLFQIFIVFVSLKNGISILLNSESKEIEKFYSYIILTMIPLWIFQNSWRIMNAYDLLFWYSCFYLYFMDNEPYKYRVNFIVNNTTVQSWTKMKIKSRY